jgi:hypothetical protein
MLGYSVKRHLVKNKSIIFSKKKVKKMGFFKRNKKKEIDDIKPLKTTADLANEIKRLSNKNEINKSKIEKIFLGAMQSAKSMAERTTLKQKHSQDLALLEDEFSNAVNKVRQDFIKQKYAKSKDKFKLK